MGSKLRKVQNPIVISCWYSPIRVVIRGCPLRITPYRISSYTRANLQILDSLTELGYRICLKRK